MMLDADVSTPRARQAAASVLLRAGADSLQTRVRRYGINSPSVLQGVVMWGEMIDATIHPPGPCDHCGQPVEFNSSSLVWEHTNRGPSRIHCLRVAGTVANRRDY